LVEETLFQPAFAEAELAPLIGEVEDELMSERDDEEELASLWFQRAFFSGTVFARRNAGELSDLPRITTDVIRELYRSRICSDTLIVVAAGDIDAKVLEAFVDRLSTLPESDEAFAQRRSDERVLPEPPAPGILLVNQPDHDQVQLRLGRIGLSGRDPQLIPFWLGTTAFGGMFTSPFVQAIRDERGWSYTAHASFARFGTLPTYWLLESAPQLADALPCLELQLEMYRALAEGTLDTEHIELGRSYLLNRFPLTVASARDLTYPAFRNALLGPEAVPLDEIPDRLAAESDDDVRAAMRYGLDAESWAAVVVGSVEKLGGAVAKQFPDARVAMVDYRSDTLSPFEELIEGEP
ncbi:MAG: insulinase family protein, partial [Myxococcota bacterium]